MLWRCESEADPRLPCYRLQALRRENGCLGSPAAAQQAADIPETLRQLHITKESP